MQVHKKKQKVKLEDGPAPPTIDTSIRDLLDKQLDTTPDVLLSRKGVEFCKEGTNSDRETLSSKTTNGADVNAEELLRYPGGVTRLAHLAVQKRNYLSPTTQSEIHVSAPSDLPSSEVIVGTSQGYTSSDVPLLPEPVVERHKLTQAEIRALPRFGKYDPGLPSKVLYIKNIHHRASKDDFMALFGHFITGNDQTVKIRVLTGKMRGQAFVEFKSVDLATEALEFANGYLMYGKPLVISYGRKQ